MRRFWVVKIVLASLALMAPAFVAGRALLFTDTRAYYALGEQVAVMLKIEPPAPASSLGDGLTPEARAERERLAYTVAGSRSMYFSAWLFLLIWVGGAWFFVWAQCIVAAATLYVLARHALDEPAPSWSFAALIGALALGSGLPYYLDFLMPDVFSGLGLAAAIGLILYWRALGRGERIWLLLVLLTACLFHTSHMLVALGLGAASLIIALALRQRAGAWLPGAGSVVALALLALAAGMVFPLAVKAIKHQTIYTPPFLTARIVSDGPGRDFLRRTCAARRPYALCRYADQPLDDSDDFLWNGDKRRGVFQLASYDERVALIREQPRFIRDVIAADPVGVAASAADNVARLATAWRIDEPLVDPSPLYADPKFVVFRRIMPGGARCDGAPGSCGPNIPESIADAMTAAGLVLSLATIAAALIAVPAVRRRHGPLLFLTILSLAGNAAVCGVLSGAFPRYQARLVWLIVFAAVLVGTLTLRVRRRGEADAMNV